MLESATAGSLAYKETVFTTALIAIHLLSMLWLIITRLCGSNVQLSSCWGMLRSLRHRI